MFLARKRSQYEMQFFMYSCVSTDNGVKQVGPEFHPRKCETCWFWVYEFVATPSTAYRRLSVPQRWYSHDLQIYINTRSTYSIHLMNVYCNYRSLFESCIVYIYIRGLEPQLALFSTAMTTKAVWGSTLSLLSSAFMSCTDWGLLWPMNA